MEPNANHVNQLVAMGFAAERVRRELVVASGNFDVGLERLLAGSNSHSVTRAGGERKVASSETPIAVHEVQVSDHPRRRTRAEGEGDTASRKRPRVVHEVVDIGERGSASQSPDSDLQRGLLASKIAAMKIALDETYNSMCHKRDDDNPSGEQEFRIHRLRRELPDDLRKSLPFELAKEVMKSLFWNKGGREKFEKDKALDNDGGSRIRRQYDQDKAQYGSVYYSFCDQVFSHLDIKEDDVFLDIGSGMGQVVLQCALQHRCFAVGLELVQSRHDDAVELERRVGKFFSYAKAWKEMRAEAHPSSSAQILARNPNRTLFLQGSFTDENDGWRTPRISPGQHRVENKEFLKSTSDALCRRIFPRLDAMEFSLTPIELFQRVDCFFLNNARGTMDARNGNKVGTKSSVIEHVKHLACYMKKGARILALDQILNFPNNRWDVNGVAEKCWITEEKVVINGTVSWHGLPQDHTVWLYTKVLDNKWYCHSCKIENTLVADGKVNVRCQFEDADGHNLNGTSQRTLRRRRG